MAVTADEIAFARDLFAGLGGITTRKMMGGLCLYCDGTIFAILDAGGGIYLKADGDMSARMEDLGATQWSYTRADGTTTRMCYWSLPDHALDDPEAATALAREALSYL